MRPAGGNAPTRVAPADILKVKKHCKDLSFSIISVADTLQHYAEARAIVGSIVVVSSDTGDGCFVPESGPGWHAVVDVRDDVVFFAVMAEAAGGAVAVEVGLSRTQEGGEKQAWNVEHRVRELLKEHCVHRRSLQGASAITVEQHKY